MMWAVVLIWGGGFVALCRSLLERLLLQWLMARVRLVMSGMRWVCGMRLVRDRVHCWMCCLVRLPSRVRLL